MFVSRESRVEVFPEPEAEAPDGGPGESDDAIIDAFNEQTLTKIRSALELTAPGEELVSSDFAFEDALETALSALYNRAAPRELDPGTIALLDALSTVVLDEVVQRGLPENELVKLLADWSIRRQAGEERVQLETRQSFSHNVELVEASPVSTDEVSAVADRGAEQPEASSGNDRDVDARLAMLVVIPSSHSAPAFLSSALFVFSSRLFVRWLRRTVYFLVDASRITPVHPRIAQQPFLHPV